MIFEDLVVKRSFVSFFMEEHEKYRKTEQGQESAKFLESNDHRVRISNIKVQVVQVYILGYDLILGYRLRLIGYWARILQEQLRIWLIDVRILFLVPNLFGCVVIKELRLIIENVPTLDRV